MARQVTVTALAAEAGVHKSTVSRQARTWGLVDKDGMVDADAYLARRSSGLDPTLQTTGKSAAAALPGLHTSVADLKSEQARLARLKADELEGKTLPRDRVEFRTFEVVRRLRDELLAWPDAIAPRLVTMTHERAIADLLTHELEEKLVRLAQALQDLSAHDDDPAPGEAEAA